MLIHIFYTKTEIFIILYYRLVQNFIIKHARVFLFDLSYMYLTFLPKMKSKIFIIYFFLLKEAKSRYFNITKALEMFNKLLICIFDKFKWN